MTPPTDPVARTLAMVRALRQHRKRMARKLEAVRGDLAEAERAPELRRFGEALLAYLHQVPARAASVSLPDPADPHGALEITLDPNVKPQANAARYFKRAAKAERALAEIPPRLAALEIEAHELTRLLERAQRELDRIAAPTSLEEVARAEPHRRRAERLEAAEPRHSSPPAPIDAELQSAIERAFDRLPPVMRRKAGVGPARVGLRGNAPAPKAELPARLRPRRLKTREGWSVLIGRNNEGNDHLTLHLARPEDYWFHAHGAAGSHVVLRRGKGKDEPSKQTLQEVAAWAAFYSQARKAGTVPVLVTRKKYVRKPRKAPAGTVMCEREKTLMVKPREPERSALADAEVAGDSIETPSE